jgi:flagellar hook-associated protein 2
MAGITSAGVGSGLDLESIIQVSVEAENAPKEARFVEKESSLNLQLTVLGQIKSDTSALTDAMEILSDIDNFTKRAATITQPSDGDIIAVSTTSAATAGSFEVEVQQLAQGSRAVQDDANSYTATTDVVTASGGTLTFTAGAKTFDVTLAAGATLADLRQAINDATDNFGLTANIINTGGVSPLSKLVMSSDETGAGNDLSITSNTAELDKVSTTANGGAAGGMVIAPADQARDAIMIIDGISTSSSSNTFTDVIQDTNITALRVDTNKGTLNIQTDKESVRETIEKFVESFNSAILGLKTAVTSKVTDGTARGLRSALINQVGSLVAGAGNLQSIYDLGISLEKDNTLKIDSSKLSDKLNESYDDIGTLFAGAGGVGLMINDTLELYTKSSGIISNQEDNVKLQQRDVESEREKHDYRMELYEERLRKKYASLDVLIASLRAQGSAVTSALSNLPGFTREK